MRSINWIAMVVIVAVMLHVGFGCAGSLQAASVRNGTLNESRGVMTAEGVAKLRTAGWRCPDAKDWPHSWDGQGDGVTIEWPTTGGRSNDGYGRISGGTNGYVNGYWGNVFKGNQVLSFWARGRGTLRVGLIAYKLSPTDNSILPGGSMPSFDIHVNSNKWVRYRYLMKKPTYKLTGHPYFQAPVGTVDFDDVDIFDSNPALDLMVAEEDKLYGTGALIENLDRARADQTFVARGKEFQAAVRAFEAAAPRLNKSLVSGFQQQVAALKPYMKTGAVTTIEAFRYNDAILLTRVLKRLTGGQVTTVRIEAKEPPAQVIDHRPGTRPIRPDTVTITDVHSDKLRYEENQQATTKATIVNKGSQAVSGTLTASMIVDLDARRDLARTAMTVGPGETRTWSFSYNVGPETYGRAIEVAFVDRSGQTVDHWQEYYPVAAEFLRVQENCFNIETKYWPSDLFVFYCNSSHYFASEPTDMGVEPFNAQVYKSGQTGYIIHTADRKNHMANLRKMGVAVTYYVNNSFSGQMGYEQVRQHPEYVLYDSNGQFACDPVYGGYPNPMELASPLEIGPRRKQMKIKPYLDREYHPWQHVMMNMANEDAVVWGVERMKAYATDQWGGLDGIFWDGCPGIWEGYAFDGSRNVPSGKYEDYVALSARNHRIFSSILKRDNPNFGTWYNWGLAGMDWAAREGLTLWQGTGVEGDPLDDAFRAATGWKNVMTLDELPSIRGLRYQELLDRLLRDRDHHIQQYGVSKGIGDMSTEVGEEPGPTKWGWPTWNYFLAQIIASQSHVTAFFVPSHRPGLQFMTRYSRFIWARDIKALPAEEAERIIELKSPEELWWKRLVYRRQKKDGYDLIVHLVRIPPTERADFNWVDEPLPLAGVTITADVGTGTLQIAVACRPYHFEEPQQVVDQLLAPASRTDKIAITIPPFRYHTMLVLRVRSDK